MSDSGTKYSFVVPRNDANLKDTWICQQGAPFGSFCVEQPEYAKQWDLNFKDFSGTVLEIGAGNGFMANHILANNVVEYTILDISGSIAQLVSSDHSLIKECDQITYIDSTNYKEIFSGSYDILISHQCLSETPPYYYTGIWNNINTTNCFIIDNSADSRDSHYNDELKSWVENYFESIEGTHRNYTVKGYHDKGIMVYIGKGKKP